MSLDDKDVSYFLDIIECIHDIVFFTEDISFHDFESDKMRKLAVERQLEVIGQAANKISKEAQDRLNTIPWSKIIGLRNRLAHDYGEILARRIWDISKSSLHSLMAEIMNIEEVKKYIDSRENT